MNNKNENKILIFLNKNIILILGAIFLLMSVKSCGINNKIGKLEDSNLRLLNKLDSLEILMGKQITNKDVIENMEEVMLNFLIYEDELDSKKITLSQIKDKIND